MATSVWSGRCVSPTNPDVPTIQGLECLFLNVLQVISFFAGLVFLFVLVTAGFKYIFSGNDPKKVASVSSTITMGIIGLVGIILSWFILRLIHNFTGVDVTKFLIPG